jgi:hypothetical protein
MMMSLQEMHEILAVPRAPFDGEEPWSAPARCTPVDLRRAADGSAPRLATRVAAWFDDEYLTVLFSASDDHLEATLYEHDASLYEEDVVEVFLGTDDPTRYFELEANPRGTTFDALIESPNGVREGLRADRDWTCEGMWTAVKIEQEPDGAMAIDLVLRIPFAGLGRKVPADGETWRANFFRIDRHPREGDEYSAWQPTMKDPADFHIAAAFGTIRFTV